MSLTRNGAVSLRCHVAERFIWLREEGNILMGYTPDQLTTAQVKRKFCFSSIISLQGTKILFILTVDYHRTMLCRLSCDARISPANKAIFWVYGVKDVLFGTTRVVLAINCHSNLFLSVRQRNVTICNGISKLMAGLSGKLCYRPLLSRLKLCCSLFKILLGNCAPF